MAKSKDTHEPEKGASKKVEIEAKANEKSVEKAQGEAGDRKGQAIENKNSVGSDKEKKPASGHEEALKTAQDNLAAINDKYLRLAAEYDNFRKRSAKERDSIYSNAKADVICKLLPVYDNLERAMKLECSDEAYFKGIEMTTIQLIEILKSMNVQPIEAVGLPFDPNFHNAVARIEDPNLGEGIIAEEVQKGFTMGERVIRFSSVVVAN